MTMDEAKKRINNKHSNGTLHKTIVQIYDDFKQERREQADIRNKSKATYIEEENERIEELVKRKYEPLIHQYQVAHKNLVNENRRIRKLAGLLNKEFDEFLKENDNPVETFNCIAEEEWYKKKKEEG